MNIKSGNDNIEEEKCRVIINNNNISTNENIG